MRQKHDDRPPTVQEAKEWYIEGYVDGDGLEELMDEAVTRREQARGDAPICDYCGEPLVRGHIVTNCGVYHRYQCADKAQRERAPDIRKLLLLTAAILFVTFALVLSAPAPPDGAIPLQVSWL